MELSLVAVVSEVTAVRKFYIYIHTDRLRQAGR